MFASALAGHLNILSMRVGDVMDLDEHLESEPALLEQGDGTVSEAAVLDELVASLSHENDSTHTADHNLAMEAHGNKTSSAPRIQPVDDVEPDTQEAVSFTRKVNVIETLPEHTVDESDLPRVESVHLPPIRQAARHAGAGIAEDD